MSQILERQVAVDLMMRGGETLRLEDVLRLRQYTFQELLLLGDVANFQVTTMLTVACLNAAIVHRIVCSSPHIWVTLCVGISS
jgi:hypothetical protein